MIARLFLMMTIIGGQAAAQYPPLREYMMPRDAEIALAKSAAPANISDYATIKVLTASGYEVVHQGNNGFVCVVMRGWTAPTYTPAQLRNLVYDATVTVFLKCSTKRSLITGRQMCRQPHRSDL